MIQAASWGTAEIREETLGIRMDTLHRYAQDIRDQMGRCTHRTESNSVSKTGGGKNLQESLGTLLAGAFSVAIDFGKTKK